MKLFRIVSEKEANTKMWRTNCYPLGLHALKTYVYTIPEPLTKNFTNLTKMFLSSLNVLHISLQDYSIKGNGEIKGKTSFLTFSVVL